MPVAHLKRKIGLVSLTLYGLGNILGAGIYVLVGKVAGYSGGNTTLAFIIAMTIAALTAFSYMELSARYPVSASVSVYSYKAFGRKWLSLSVGLIMIAGGITSAAALAQGFGGYLSEFIAIPIAFSSVILLVIVALLAAKGIGESVKSAAILTLIELGGLLLVIWVGRSTLGNFDYGNVFSLDPSVGIAGLLTGAFLAFYAFIGFEDMANVGEEVKNVKRVMPTAILLSLLISTSVYLLIVVVSLSTVSVSQLSNSDAPLSLVYNLNGGRFPQVLSLIGMVAAANGIVVQMIMGSRFLYGLAKQGWLDQRLGNVNSKTSTPLIATFTVALLMIISTLLLPLTALAKITSFLILGIFALVNGSLITIKRHHDKKVNSITVPIIVPILGLVTCLSLAGYQVYVWL
ncbi:amino acid permease [Candidatus Saccharibacteria bacterium]|nr:amino acid permease [Candidatus Saccharibacteria bacterium]